MNAPGAGAGSAPARPDVFVSYSRTDQDFARRLTERLEALGKDVWVDWEDIRPTAEWWERIRAGIESGRAFVATLSPDFVTSKVCGQELEHAVELNKRIVPILRRDVGDAELPEALAARNWIFFRDEDGFEAAVGTLVEALETDLDWLDAHARLLVRAVEWERNGRDRSFLLRGSDLAAAERWLAEQGSHRESATPLQAEYVVASRHAARRRQRITLGAVLVALAVAVALAVVAILQRDTAIRNEELSRSRELAASANGQLATDPQLGVLLAVEAARVSRTPEAEDALRAALGRDFAQRTLHSPGFFVENARFDRTGRRILTAGNDTARLWDAASGRQLETFREQDSLLDDAALSPDGKTVATVGTLSASLWDVATGKRRAGLAGHGNEIHAVEFSPDGSLVATASQDGTTRLWNARTGRKLRVLASPGSEAVAFGPSRDLLATAGDRPALWSTRTGRRLAALRGHTSSVDDVSFSPGGTLVATASGDGTARVWSTRDGRLLHVLRGHTSGVAVVAFDRAGKLLATGGDDGTAVVWQVSGRRVSELRGHSSFVTSVDFSPDSRFLLTGSEDATARVWDIASGRSVAELLGHADGLTAARFSPDGRRILTASTDETARTWRSPAAGPAKTYPGRRAQLGAGDRLVVTSVRDDVAVYDRETGRRVRLPTGSLVFDTDVSPDGRLILSAGDSDTAILWDARTGARRATMETPDQVESAKFSADGELIALGVADGSARLYRTGETRSFLAVRHPKPPTPADEFEDEPSTIVFDAEFSADGTLLVTASGDKTARVWEVTTGKLVSVFRGHGSELSAATFSPDGTTVASVADSGAPRLWDARTGRARVRLRGRAGLAGSPSFSPDGSRLLTVEDKTVRIRDVRTGAIVLELRIPAAIVGQAGARFSHDGRFVVAGDSGSVRVWDAVRGRDVETFVGGGEEGVDISRDDAFVLGSRADSSAVYACELCRPLDKLLETARRRVHRTLTADERRTYLHE